MRWGTLADDSKQLYTPNMAAGNTVTSHANHEYDEIDISTPHRLLNVSVKAVTGLSFD